MPAHYTQQYAERAWSSIDEALITELVERVGWLAVVPVIRTRNFGWSRTPSLLVAASHEVGAAIVLHSYQHIYETDSAGIWALTIAVSLLHRAWRYSALCLAYCRLGEAIAICINQRR